MTKRKFTLMNPNMEMTTRLGLKQFKQTARKLELTFELMNKAALTGKYVTFTFKNPLGVRYSDEAHRADLIYSPVRDEHHNELGTRLCLARAEDSTNSEICSMVC